MMVRRLVSAWTSVACPLLSLINVTASEAEYLDKPKDTIVASVTGARENVLLWDAKLWPETQVVFGFTEQSAAARLTDQSEGES